MMTIPLTRGKLAIVDDEDYERLSQFYWCFDHGYAVRTVRKEEKLGCSVYYMHHEIIGRKPNMETDHYNGNGLDNRRSNLRSVSRSENMINSRTPKTNTSGARGVVILNSRNQWRAQLTVQGNHYSSQPYATVRMAALAYNMSAIKHFGPMFQHFNQVFKFGTNMIKKHPDSERYKFDVRSAKQFRPTPRNNTSGWRGVSFHRVRGEWRAYLKVHKRQYSSGNHITSRMAALAFNNLALKHYGPKFEFFNKVFCQ